MTKICGIEYSILGIPLERRLQTAAVLLIALIQFVSPLIITILIFYSIFYTNSHMLVAIYACWLAYDWKSPSRGGYKWNPMRNLRIYEYVVNYFPAKLHKTAELPTGNNYLIGVHPHGIIAQSTIINFATNITGVVDLFPGLNIRVCTLACQFFLPFRREWGLLHGMIDCSQQGLEYRLDIDRKINNITVLVVGGAEEALEAHPGTYVLSLKKRKGFVRIALKTGAHLVPCFSFGENELYSQMNNPPGSTIRYIQTRIKHVFGFSTPLFNGRGIFNYNFGILPRRVPLNTVVGSPIPVKKITNPSSGEIDDLHARYVSALIDLFESHKKMYGVSQKTRIILN